MTWGPPPVSPPYMTVWQVNRGDDPKNEVFVKKFLEKFSPILEMWFKTFFQKF